MTSIDQIPLTLGPDDSPQLEFTGTSLTPNAIVQGDSREVMQAVADESVRLIVTRDLVERRSPSAYLEDLLLVFQECERVLVPNGKLCINTPIGS